MDQKSDCERSFGVWYFDEVASFFVRAAFLCPMENPSSPTSIFQRHRRHHHTTRHHAIPTNRCFWIKFGGCWEGEEGCCFRLGHSFENPHTCQVRINSQKLILVGHVDRYLRHPSTSHNNDCRTTHLDLFCGDSVEYLSQFDEVPRLLCCSYRSRFLLS